jgi:hypothetical protein
VPLLDKAGLNAVTVDLPSSGEHPSTYLACIEDQAIPYAAQQAMSAHAGTVETITSSHSPFLSHPDAVAVLVVAATGR